MKSDEAPVIVEQDFEKSTSVVWNAITDVDEMRNWYFDNIPDFKAEVGFNTQFLVESGGRRFVHLWEVTEVETLNKVVYNWKFEGYPGDSYVSFEVSGDDESSQLRVTAEVQESFPRNIPEFTRESCMGGWTYFINQRLKAYLDG